MGKSKFEVWRLLGTEPVTTASLADARGVTQRTVQQHLARLREVGLATRQVNGWVKGPDTPQQVGELLSTAGAGARQVERHLIERQAYREQLRRFAMRDDKPFVVDPETGEIYSFDELSEDRPSPSRCPSPASGLRRGARRLSDSRSGVPRRDRDRESATG
jgi:biotin operon repressor